MKYGSIKTNYFKIISAILVFAVMIFCTGLHVHAEEVKDGISVTVSSDKEKYNSEDEVKLKITVKNTNDFEASNIKIENVLPDGISLVSGDKSKDNIKLKANEEVTMNLTVKKTDSGQTESKSITTSNSNATINTISGQAKSKSTTTSNSNTTINTTAKDKTTSTTERIPNTGENNIILITLIVMLISIVIIVVCLMLKDRKKYSKFLSVLICLGVINAFGITSIVHASSKSNHSFTYEYTYKIDNADYIHKIVVSYSLSDNNNTIEEKKLQDGYVKDNLEQFAMKDRFDELMDISKTIISNTKCEFKNIQYGKDGKGTADIIVFAPDMEKILSDGLKFATENQEIILKYNGANLQEKFQNWVNDYSIELINSNKYEPIKTELPITIYKENNQWIINVDSKLNNALTGNMNSFFEDQLNELYK